jgi:ectoine hydroxylase-related dioxygenase (phytanoyl-CoA dioxygenase family)
MISESQIDEFQRDGVVLLRGAFTDWVEEMRAGVDRNMREPGEYASENSVTEGRFFDDYCNWNRIPEFEHLIRKSPMAEIAAKVMRSNTAQIFHDHVLVKEPGTPKSTPWHQDVPYYFTQGQQTVSFWMPLDPVKDASLRLIAGSHRWEKMIRPVSWADDTDFYDKAQDWTPVPDPDANPDDTKVVEWPMQPGDAVLFDFRTAHGARGNQQTTRRRALSVRWLGDDVRYTARPGRTSPPYPGHNMVEGQKLRTDWFPVIWPKM